MRNRVLLMGQPISGATEWRGSKLVVDIAFGPPAHQLSRPKYE